MAICQRSNPPALFGEDLHPARKKLAGIRIYPHEREAQQETRSIRANPYWGARMCCRLAATVLINRYGREISAAGQTGAFREVWIPIAYPRRSILMKSR
jgi:hypothetical protein